MASSISATPASPLYTVSIDCEIAIGGVSKRREVANVSGDEERGSECQWKRARCLSFLQPVCTSVQGVGSRLVKQAHVTSNPGGEVEPR